MLLSMLLVFLANLVPVLGVPIPATVLNGQDALLSIVQMPAGIPTATFAIGEAGATNAGLLAAAILATNDPDLAERLKAFRAAQTASVPAAATSPPCTPAPGPRSMM